MEDIRMKKMIDYKLMRKFLVLTFLVLGLIFIASNDRYTQSVEAIRCCESCDGDGDSNIAENNCYYDAYFGGGCGPGISPPQCYSDCMGEVNYCYSHCTYCNSSSGPGGGCMSTSDCPINYFCGANNTCERY